MQRRAQEVIDRCWALGRRQSHRAHPRRRRRRPVQRRARGRGAQRPRRAHRSARHPERRAGTVAAGDCGATRRRSATCWPSRPRRWRSSRRSAARERCPYAVIGAIDASGRLTVRDPLFGNDPVDMPLEVLLGKPPRLTREVAQRQHHAAGVRHRRASTCARRAYRVLRLPTVADKTFLITIGDRTVGGLISRDQMVGPWQVPVSDVAVTLADYQGYGRRGDGHRRAHAGRGARRARLRAPRGRRGDHQHAGGGHRGAVADVRLSANWMAACGEPRRGRRALRHGARRRRRSCARSSASPFRSARTRCR